MRSGVLTFFTAESITPVDLAVALEERGFGSLFATEHSHVPVGTKTPYPMGGPIPPEYYRTMDPFVSLTAAAVAAKSLVLGTGIALVAQRDPIQMANEIASLDVVSNGRFCFGAGVGWLREEIANHGVDPSVRGRVVDERLRAMIEIWTKDEAEFHGEYVDFDLIYSWPKPVTKPYPPLYLGGGPAGFQRIADLGAGWMSLGPSAAFIADDLVKLHDVVGPDVPVIGSHVGDPKADELAAYVALGIEHLVVHLPTAPRDESLRFLDDLQAEFAKLG